MQTPFAGRMFLGADDNTFDINSATPSLLFVVEPEDAGKIVKKRPFERNTNTFEEIQV
jgi:hypothetical protein